MGTKERRREIWKDCPAILDALDRLERVEAGFDPDDDTACTCYETDYFDGDPEDLEDAPPCPLHPHGPTGPRGPEYNYKEPESPFLAPESAVTKADIKGPHQEGPEAENFLDRVGTLELFGAL